MAKTPPAGAVSVVKQAANWPGSSHPAAVATQVFTDERKNALRFGASLSPWITSISSVWFSAGFAYAQAAGVIKSIVAGSGDHSAKYKVPGVLASIARKPCSRQRSIAVLL